jgi:hypothetical protein
MIADALDKRIEASDKGDEDGPDDDDDGLAGVMAPRVSGTLMHEHPGP